jgi:hypothetical protein
MKTTLAFYFACMSIIQAVGGSFKTWDMCVVSFILIGVPLVLAIGLYAGLRVARFSAIAVCAVGTGAALVMGLVVGSYLLVLPAAASGIPLVGLLHPRCRKECHRDLRKRPGVAGTDTTIGTTGKEKDGKER